MQASSEYQRLPLTTCYTSAVSAVGFGWTTMRRRDFVALIVSFPRLCTRTKKALPDRMARIRRCLTGGDRSIVERCTSRRAGSSTAVISKSFTDMPAATRRVFRSWPRNLLRRSPTFFLQLVVTLSKLCLMQAGAPYLSWVALATVQYGQD